MVEERVGGGVGGSSADGDGEGGYALELKLVTVQAREPPAWPMSVCARMIRPDTSVWASRCAVTRMTS